MMRGIRCATIMEKPFKPCLLKVVGAHIDNKTKEFFHRGRIMKD